MSNIEIKPDDIIRAITDQRNTALNNLAVALAKIRVLEKQLEEVPKTQEKYIPDTTKE